MPTTTRLACLATSSYPLTGTERGRQCSGIFNNTWLNEDRSDTSTTKYWDLFTMYNLNFENGVSLESIEDAHNCRILNITNWKIAHHKIVYQWPEGLILGFGQVQHTNKCHSLGQSPLRQVRGVGIYLYILTHFLHIYSWGVKLPNSPYTWIGFEFIYSQWRHVVAGRYCIRVSYRCYWEHTEFN